MNPDSQQCDSLPQPTASVILSVGEDPSEHSPFDLIAKNFSSMERLLRVTAWALRFTKKCRRQDTSNKNHLSIRELLAAKKLWLRSCQRNHFTPIFAAIANNTKNDTVQSLRLYVDGEGLLRSRGRLERANLPTNTKFPILLPSKACLTTLIIKQYHHTLMHPGVAHTLASLREKYWVPRGRSSVKSVLKQCLTCKRIEGGGGAFEMPAMAPLPPERVNCAEAFQYTGVDYFGPLF